MERIVFPLRSRMKRHEVGDLQAALAGLGFDIGGREAARRRFGADTRRAVMLFQEAQGLEPTGVVDHPTAEALTRERERRALVGASAEMSGEGGAVPQGSTRPFSGAVAGAIDLDRDGEDPKSQAMRVATVAVEEQRAAVSTTDEQFLVHGRVLWPDGSPEAGVTVRAFDKDLRVEAELGSAPAHADGTYLVHYPQARLSRPDKSRADLIVRAYDRSGTEIAASSLICSAAAEELVDLVVGDQPLRQRSEYERLVATIRPYLRDITVADLGRDDVEFLVCSAEVDRLHVATLAVASRLAATTSLPEWFFYALGRQGLRLQLEALVLHPRRVLTNAVRAAIAANVVPAPSGAEVLDRLLDQLQAVLLRMAFHESGDRTRFSIGALLGTSLVGRDRQEAFLARYLARPESAEEFWNALEEDHRFSREAVHDLRLTLALGRLTRYRLPILEQLRRLRENGELRSLRDLARLDRAHWRDILRAAGVADGADLPGQTAADRLEHYITSLRAPIERLFPGDSLRRALTKAPGTEPGVARLLTNAEDLDLYWTNIDDYLDAHREAALVGIPAAQQETAIAQVKRLQRLLRVSPRADHVRVLDAAGFDSAVAIARTPRRRFRARFVETAQRIKDTLDDAYEVTATSTDETEGESAPSVLMMMNSAASPAAVADAIQAAAVTKTSMYVHQYANLVTGLQRWSGAFGAPQNSQSQVEDDAEIADLETLFGSQSFCACEHCRSVYSPAAYLVDLLHELDDVRSTNGALVYQDPADVPGPIGNLMKRRPDIANTPLTCQNTNTPLPYVDLVNEVLESYVEAHLDSGGGWTDSAVAGTPTIKAYDTGTLTADELRAVPQNVIPEVYEYFGSTAVYPMTLPFHRPLEVARAYLAHLGTSRADVMDVFRTAGTPSGLALVVERLGMSPAQYQIIAATSSTDPVFDATDGPQQTWTYYGYGSAAELTKLAHVPEMLRRTGLAFGDLVAVLKTRFLNPQLYSTSPTNSVQIQFPTSIADGCDTSAMELTQLGPNDDPAFAKSWLDRLQRFVRLWRALGWGIADVDCAVSAVGGALDDTALERLASVKELAEALDQPVEVLLGLWGPLDTWGEESRYDQVFLNRAVLQDPSQWKAFEDARSSTSNKKLNELLPTVAAALAVTEADIERIRTHAGLTADPPLDLEHLTLLYRYVTLASALRLRVRDLVTLLHLVPASMNPFTPGDPRPTVEFVRTVRGVEASGFSIPLLNYLFRDEAEPTRHPAPTRALVASTLGALQDGLASIHQETLAGEQAPAERLRASLEVAAGPALLSLDVPDDVDRALAVLDPRQTEFMGLSPTTDPIEFRKSFVTDHFASFMPNAAADLFGTPLPKSDSVPDAELRFLENAGKVLDALVPWLRRKLQEALVVETMAAAMGVDQGLMRRLLETLAWPAPSGTVLGFLLGLVDPAGVPTGLQLDEVPPKPPTVMFHRVFKAAALARGFGMTEAELVLFTGASSPLLTFDPNAPLALDLDELPVSGADPAPSMQPGQLFDVWRALRAYYELRDGLPRSEKTLVDYFTADAADTLKTLEEVTGWGQVQIGAVVQGFGVPADDLPGLIRLQRAMSLLTRVGVTPERMFAWASKPPSHSDADEVVQTVKARYTGAQWLEVARGINDPLRERQRDALVALLLPRLQGAPFPIETPNDLFDYFLIDVKMNSCMLTSRIKQAISSVQLFVQRCLLNLEPGVSPDEIEPGRWEWMKHYRIWEANRKVFLYPENWIEPELRDDKTPFFRDLETELLQNELTEETIERALTTYLYRLDQVARLDIRAFCRQDDAGREIYHVFGRTWNDPNAYYYRRGTFAVGSGDGEWTAWEQVDMDITSDHIIPAVVNGRLLAFWPLFDQKPDQNDRSRSVFHIKLAYGEREGGRWRKKGTSAEAEVIRSVSFDESDPPTSGVFGSTLARSASYMFLVTPDSEPLQIEVGYCDPLSEKTFYQVNRVGVFAMDQCRGGGQISGRGVTTAVFTLGPWGSRPESQQFVRADGGLSVTPFHPQRVLDDTPAGSVVILAAVKAKDAEIPYSFFFQDGPASGSQTYFVRPVVETKGPLLDPHSTDVGDGVLDVPIVDATPVDTWGPDPVLALALVGVGADVPGGVSGGLATEWSG